MQALAVMAFAVVSAAPLVTKGAEITDAKAIQAFLADPHTHLYDVRDPKGWKSYRKLIQVGIKQPNGSCRYPMAISTPGTYASFATEIAVNNVRCQSLVLEGNPGGSPVRTAQAATARNSKPPSNVPARKTAVQGQAGKTAGTR